VQQTSSADPYFCCGWCTGDSAEDPDGSLHVVAVDSGTWPTDGGGVATCRELVLDYVQHVRWSVLSEIGNDFKQVHLVAWVSILPIDSVCACVSVVWMLGSSQGQVGLHTI